MNFPYGPASLAIGIIALLTGLTLLPSTAGPAANDSEPHLVYVTFAREHVPAYQAVIPQFERENHCHVDLELVDAHAVSDRLAAALQVGADVPDMCEILDGSMGYFTSGPLEDVGLADLTDRLKSSGMYDKLLKAKFTKWSSRGHIFALPHDVHPVMLAYRHDILESYGVDASTLTTWDKFCQVGRDITAKSIGKDGIPTHYMMDLEADGGDYLRILMLQQGDTLFNDAGQCVMDDPRTADTMVWYCHQIEGPDRISFPCGWDQPLNEAMINGLALFYVCPDWRANQTKLDVPMLAGKMSLIPLPAWTEGGCRTTTWGGTGLTITKHCQEEGKFDLAWKLAMFLYYDPSQLGKRFHATGILPPLKEAWTLPEFKVQSDFYAGVSQGQVYSALAPDVPPEPSSPYQNMARDKLGEAFSNTADFYKANGFRDDGLREFAQNEIHRVAGQVRNVMARNAFLSLGQSNSQIGTAAGGRQ